VLFSTGTIHSPHRSINRAVVLFSIVLVLIGHVSAQTPTGPTTLHTTTTLVVVPALVQTPSKDLVFSLTADDFALTDNGAPQKVNLEEDIARPLSLVVLMQTGGAARQQFANYTHLETMLASVLGDAPNKAAIVNFDSRPEYDSSFTSDIAQWTDAINHPEPGDDGAAIFDGLAYALDLLKQQPPDTRRAILLISQQYDSGSKTKLKDIIRNLGETNTAVYSITFSVEKTKIKQAFTNPSPPPNQPATLDKGVMLGDGQQYVNYFDLGAPIALAMGAMRKNLSAEVASLAGGEFIGFSNRAELDQALGTLTNHIHNGYLLSFRPTTSDPGLHTLKVGVTGHPEFLIKARTNYWAESKLQP
jgi:VWFA-related protein